LKFVKVTRVKNLEGKSGNQTHTIDFS